MLSGRYTLMNGFLDVPLTTLQLTTFGPWKRVDSRLHPIERSRETRATPYCDPPPLAGRSVKQKML